MVRMMQWLQYNDFDENRQLIIKLRFHLYLSLSLTDYRCLCSPVVPRLTALPARASSQLRRERTCREVELGCLQSTQYKRSDGIRDSQTRDRNVWHPLSSPLLSSELQSRAFPLLVWRLRDAESVELQCGGLSVRSTSRIGLVGPNTVTSQTGGSTHTLTHIIPLSLPYIVKSIYTASLHHRIVTTNTEIYQTWTLLTLGHKPVSAFFVWNCIRRLHCIIVFQVYFFTGERESSIPSTQPN